MAMPASAEVPGLKRRTSILGKFLAAFDDSNINADADGAGDARHAGKIQIKKQLSVSQRIQRAFGFGASSASGGVDHDPVQPPLPAESAAVAPLPLPACHRIESMAGTMFSSIRLVSIRTSTHHARTRTPFFVVLCATRTQK